MQLALIDVLCEYGADPNAAARATALHGEIEALKALIGRGARIDLPVAAALGRTGTRAGCSWGLAERIGIWR